MTESEPKRPTPRDHPILVALIGAAAVIAAALIAVFAHGGSGPPLTTTSGSSDSASGIGLGHSRLTIDDAVNGGVWALVAPNQARLFGRGQRPANAKRWYVNGTVVRISCSERARGYGVKNQGVEQRWYWWAKLASNSLWVPMAGLLQTKVDGPSGEPVCGH